MAIAELAVSAQRWIEDEFRDPQSDGVAFLRELADEVAGHERALVPRRTGRTMGSIHVDEVVGAGGLIEEHVASRDPQTSVLNSVHGYVRNPGPHTSAPMRSRGTGKTTRRSYPFAREALLAVTVVRLWHVVSVKRSR